MFPEVCFSTHSVLRCLAHAPIICDSVFFHTNIIITSRSVHQYGLQLVIYLKSTKASDKAVSRKIRKYALGDYDAISDSLDSTEWDLLLSGDVDIRWEN